MNFDFDFDFQNVQNTSDNDYRTTTELIVITHTHTKNSDIVEYKMLVVECNSFADFPSDLSISLRESNLNHVWIEISIACGYDCSHIRCPGGKQSS